MNRNLTNLIAVATAASTAFLTSTVAMETAKAATFTLTDEAAAKYGFAETWELTAPNAQSVGELFDEIEAYGDDVEGRGDWEVRYGEWELRNEGNWVYRYEGEEVVYEDVIYNDVGEIEDVELDYEWVDVVDALVDGGWGEIYLSDGMRRSEANTVEADWTVSGGSASVQPVPEPSSAIALGVLGGGLVASRRRRRSK